MFKTELTWVNPFNGGYVIMPSIFFETAINFSSASDNSLEAGGILVGKYRGPHIEISALTEPMPTDIRSRYSFHRKDKGHGLFAKSQWKASGKTETFLGEWHTHPEAFPTPSPLDLSSWAKLSPASGRHMFFVIVGTDGHWAGVSSNIREQIQISPATSFLEI